MITLITACITSFIFGGIIGVSGALFIAGIGRNNEKYDYYQEGYVDGYNKAKECGNAAYSPPDSCDV